MIQTKYAATSKVTSPGLAGKVPFFVIIIVNYNSGTELIDCIEALSRLEGVDFRMVLVDNGSTSERLAPILNFFEARLSDPSWDFQLLHRPEAERLLRWNILLTGVNAGFTAGNNAGVKLARSHGPRGYWFLNPDTQADPQALIELVEETENGGVCLSGSTLLSGKFDSDTSLNDAIVQGVGVHFNTLTTRSAQLCAGLPVKNLPHEALVIDQITYVIGASFYLSSATMDWLEKMDERYFVYFEELDLAERLKGQGRIGWAKKSFVHHMEGASIGTSRIGRPTDFSLMHFHLSMLLFYRKWYPYLLPIALVRCWYNAFRYAIKFDHRAVTAITKAILAGLTAKG
jgi:GT2 family glycosyltransferase